MSCYILNMFYCVFIFLWSLFMFSGAIVNKENKGFYISGYNTSNAMEVNQTAIIYQYDKDEVLNISCHIKAQQPVTLLKWLHNERIIGTENNSNKNKLLFNITKSNDKDILVCCAAEDGTGLGKHDKRKDKKLILILKYIDHEDKKDKHNGDHWIEKLLNSTLFWIAILVAIVVIILTAILVFAGKRSYRLKEDTVGLHPAVSKASVFTTDSRTPIIPQHSITEDKVGLHPAVSNASYFTTTSRTPTIPRHEITEVNYYTNATYNNNKKTQLHASREIINSEYQEPIDSQTYCEPQVYCEPEKQFYAEPIPKKLRNKNDTAYVNYNKSNGSANINNKNIDLYQNWEDVRDNEFYYYTDTC